MAPASSHWLLTDGASKGLQDWARRAPLNRIIQSGEATENSAITRLAARRSLDTSDGLDILVSVANTGLATDARRLELRSGRQLLQTAELELSPGQVFHWQTQVIAAEQSLTASLVPGDSLTADDELTISLQRFQPLVARVNADCGQALRTAIATHPALELSDASINPQLQVSCPREQFPDAAGAGAQIRALVASTQALDSTPVWSADVGVRQDLVLPAGWISISAWPQGMSDRGNKDVFGFADLPLVLLRDQSVVDTIIDLDNPQFTRQPEYAAFVATLVDLATGRQLLDETISASRDSQASVVNPTQIDVASSQSPLTRHTARSPLTSIFVIVALMLVLLDSALFLSARHRALRA
jgi:hypothetical protein